jgi:hypothetical protein
MNDMDNIIEIAKSYLADQPSQWLILLKELSRQIAAWAATELEGIEGATTENEI